MDPEPGWNGGRQLGCVDVDTDDLYTDALQESVWKDAPVFRGEKGCKIVFFLEPFENMPAQIQFFKDGDPDPQLEVFTRGKHFLIYGEHPHSTPEKPIFYTCVRGFGEPLPVLKWIDVRYAVDQLARKHNLTVRGKKPVNWQNVKKHTSSGRSISDTLNLRVEDFLRPENPVQHGDEIQGAHPVHGSETGMNLTVNLRENVWYCFRCGSGGGPLEAYAVSRGIISCSEAGGGCLQGQKFKEVLESLRKDGYEVPEEKRPSQASPKPDTPDTPGEPPLWTVTKGGRVTLDHQAMADVLINRHFPITFKRELWIYVDGIYQPEEGEIQEFVAQVARRAGFTGSIITAVREVTAYMAASRIEREYPFNQYPDALPVANGVLEIDWNLREVTLRPYAPKYLFTHKWPVIFDKSADSAPFHDMVLSRYVDDEETEALYQIPAQAILHFLGYGPFKKSYILEGPANGGKSTYLVNWMNCLFGEKVISNVSLQAIGMDRFAASKLEGCVINRGDDLADIPLENIESFKKYTGSFSHDIERKFLPAYPGRITAVHIYAANIPPQVPDRVAFDPAFWGRWIYLRFNNVFPVDPGFVKRAFTPEAISGSFNRVLKTMFTMHATGALVYEQDLSEVREAWQAAANPFQQFVNEQMSPTKDPVLHDKGHLWQSFNAWAEKKLISPRKIPSTITGFTQLIYSSGFTTTRRGKKNNQEWMYEAKFQFKSDSPYKR
ncbi:MAG: hypothetical protein QME27_01070 [Syntrophaceae bacterium]|nr:hypothetical protein [Syntrophaceae bacterium]